MSAAGQGRRPGGSGGSGRPERGGRPAGGKSGRPTGGKPERGDGSKSAGRTYGAPSRGPARPKRATPRPDAGPAHDVHVADGVRLQKVLATAGFGSRRACEVMIEDGRVEVDGQIVTELGVRVDPVHAVIHVDGLRLQLDASKITIAFNKPVGVVSTMEDTDGRPDLSQFFGDRKERLFHVGRLDTDSEGLLLLTNDGELANRLTHPKYGVQKTYLVEVKGRLANGVGKQLLDGIGLDDGTAKLDAFKLIAAVPDASQIEVVLHEGRNRIVRRMFAKVGYPVTRLVRTRMGPIRLGDLPPGRHRVLGQTELGTLMSAVDL